MPGLELCPQGDVLRQFVLGALPPATFDELAEHLRKCLACVHRLQQGEAHDSLGELVRACTTADGALHRSAVERLIRRLHSRPRAAGESAGSSKVSLFHAEPPSAPSGREAEEPDLAFLEPARGPGETGRLGAYRILRVLGSGGMGVVLQAEDVRLERLVALKVMRPEAARNPSSRQRFLREARATAALKHDHIVTIYEVGEANGMPFLAMELLEGYPLDRWLASGRRPRIAQVLRVGREIARGLAAAHDKGLIHRDIKPANLWLDKTTGRVKILDFGLARPAAADAHLTRSGDVVGTPAFMAPEQARGEKLDGRCDLFGLGCVLYRLCTGTFPFKGETSLATLMAIALEHPRPVRDLSPDTPPELADLVMQLLAKDPRGRPESAQAVAARLLALERALAAATPTAIQSAVALPVATPVSVPASGDRTTALPVDLAAPFRNLGDTTEPPRPPKHRPPFRLPWPALVAAALALAVLLAGGLGVRRLVRGPADPTDDRHAHQAQSGLPDAPVRPEPLPPAANLPRRPLDPPPGLVHRLEGHTDMIHDVVFLPDSRRALSASWDRTVRLWDAIEGRELHRFEIRMGDLWQLQSLSVSPDGRLVAAAGLGPNICLWTMEAPKPEPTIFLHGAGPGVTCIQFAPDGRSLLSARVDGQLKLWDLAERRVVKEFTSSIRRIQALTFLPDGRRFFCGGMSPAPDERLQLWDVETGQQVRAFTGHPSGVSQIRLVNGTRKLLTAGSGGAVTLWDVEAGKPVSSFEAHQGRVVRAHWMADERFLVTSGDDKAIRVWDVVRREKRHEFTADAYCTAYSAVSPDGRWVVSGAGWRQGMPPQRENDYALRVWRLPELDR